MSFDLFFCREEPTDVTVEELRDWTRKWKHFTEYSSEGSFDFGYKNENTGVYFAIGYRFPDGVARPEPDDPELPSFVDGYYPVSLDFNINFQRPSFFALEAMPIVFDLAKTFDLLMGNPQNEYSSPAASETTNYISGRTDDPAVEKGERQSSDEGDKNEVLSSEEGIPLPRFPDMVLRPRLYSAEELIADWRRVNEWAVDEHMRGTYYDADIYEENILPYASPETSLAYWRYMREYDDLKEQFANFLVHRIILVKHIKTNRVYTMSVWFGPCQEILPPVDYFSIARDERALFGLRRKETAYLTEARNVVELLQPGLQSFDPIPGTYLITEEVLINSPEDGFMDQAQEFFENERFQLKSNEFQILSSDDFVDTGSLIPD